MMIDWSFPELLVVSLVVASFFHLVHYLLDSGGNLSYSDPVGSKVLNAALMMVLQAGFITAYQVFINNGGFGPELYFLYVLTVVFHSLQGAFDQSWKRAKFVNFLLITVVSSASMVLLFNYLL